MSVYRKPTFFGVGGEGSGGVANWNALLVMCSGGVSDSHVPILRSLSTALCVGWGVYRGIGRLWLEPCFGSFTDFAEALLVSRDCFPGKPIGASRERRDKPEFCASTSSCQQTMTAMIRRELCLLITPMSPSLLSRLP